MHKSFKLYEALNYNDQLIKMDQWHNGVRGANIASMSDAKLRLNWDICKQQGYTSEASQLEAEGRRRGLSWANGQPKATGGMSQAVGAANQATGAQTNTQLMPKFTILDFSDSFVQNIVTNKSNISKYIYNVAGYSSKPKLDLLRALIVSIILRIPEVDKIKQGLHQYGISDSTIKTAVTECLQDPAVMERLQEIAGQFKESLSEDVDEFQVNSLDKTTPYMLRNDGELLSCGDIHPYIKMQYTQPFEETVKTLLINCDFLKWFYLNTRVDLVKELIVKVLNSLEQTPRIIEIKNDLNITSDAQVDLQEALETLNNLTNQEFCKVRTSNFKYKYGGENGEIYFRIGSENFNWFDLIWNVVYKFANQIKYVTIMKDYAATGERFKYIEDGKNVFNKMPVDEFLTLSGRPVVENLEEDTIKQNGKWVNKGKKGTHGSFKTKKAADAQRKAMFANGFNEELSINDLEEDIEKHDTLNQKLWNEDNTLKSEVKEKINLIVNEFIDGLKEDDINLNIKDIIIIGSNCSYNYTKDSDIDIHIITDKVSQDVTGDLYDKLYSAYRSIFNKNIQIDFYGIPVEIYVETEGMPRVSNGCYSVLNDTWIKEPVKEDIPEIDREAFDTEFKTWEDKYTEIVNKVNGELDEKLSTPLIDEINKFIDDIYELRKTGLASEGEYGTGNLVFKEVRNKGYLDNLKDLRHKLIGKELSLEESLEQTVDQDLSDNRQPIEEESEVEYEEPVSYSKGVAWMHCLKENLGEDKALSVSDVFSNGKETIEVIEFNEQPEHITNSTKIKIKFTNSKVPNGKETILEYGKLLDYLNKNGFKQDIAERLADKDRINYRDELSRLTFNRALIDENGMFHIYQIKEDEVTSLVNKIRNLDFIDWVQSSGSGQYDFNKLKFGTLPSRYFTIYGKIKD